MNKGRLPSEIIEEVLPLVDHFVEATSFERLSLWKEWNDRGEWIDICTGLGCTAGSHNTYIHFRFARINDKLVAFYEPTGSVVYWDDVEEFVRQRRMQ